MTKNLDSEGLKSIAENYDLFYIDLWGVMHDGIKLHGGAILALKKLLEINKDFVLLTNAPRPIQPVKEFLDKMGMEKEFRDKVLFGKWSGTEVKRDGKEYSIMKESDIMGISGK